MRSSPVDSAHPRILIVDDEPRVAESLAFLLQASHYSTVTAFSGDEAKNHLNTEAFDLILTDLVMPEMSGLELLEFIQRRGIAAPVIVLTGQGSIRTAVEALKRGAYDYLQKPINNDRFKTVVKHAIEKHRLEQERQHQEQERARLEREAARLKLYLELVLESADEIAILAATREGKVRIVNRGAELLFGCKASEIIDRPLLDLLPHPPLHHTVERMLRDGHSPFWKSEIEWALPGGEVRWLTVFVRPIEAGSEQSEGLLLVATDITAQKKLEQQLQHLSITDDLTSLYNQRYFFELLRREAERAKRTHDPFSLCLFDLDLFKQFNDHYGHLCGDEALRRTGSLVHSTIRQQVDYAFRYGGDEFAILLPQTNLEEACIFAERLRVRAEVELSERSQASFVFDLPLPTTLPPTPVKLTLSIGVAEFQIGQDERAFLEEVDRALYEAKRRGGNTVCSAPRSKAHVPSTP